MAVRTRRGAVCWLVGAIAALACSMAAAQSTSGSNDPFTVENLIGDAVSLSNQDYPDVERAIQRFKNSDAAGALEYLKQAKQKYAKLPPTELTMAKLYIFARAGQEGRAWLESTVTEHPADPEAYLLLADLAFTEGRITEASALFDKAAGLVNDFDENAKRKNNFEIRVLAGRAAVFERRQQWEQAAELLAKWVELDPDSSAAHTRLGITNFQLGKADQAYAEFAKARELRPDSPHPSIMMGQLHTQAKDLQKARAAFEKAYAEDKKNEATARAYAEWLVQQNDLDKAQQVAEAMRQDSPDSVQALMLDGVVAKMRNQFDEAEEALKKVLDLDPANAGARNLLALILTESDNVNDQENALRHAQVNAERFPQNSQTNVTLAWVLFKLNRAEEAKVALQRGAQAGNLNADSAYLISRIFVQQNQREQARKALTELLQKAGAGVFMYRKEAEALLKELGGEIPEANPGLPSVSGADADPINPTTGGTTSPSTP